MLSSGLLTLLMTSFVVTVTNGMPMDLAVEDYEMFANNEAKSVSKGIRKNLLEISDSD